MRSPGAAPRTNSARPSGRRRKPSPPGTSFSTASSSPRSSAVIASFPDASGGAENLVPHHVRDPEACVVALEVVQHVVLLQPQAVGALRVEVMNVVVGDVVEHVPNHVT